MSAGLSTAAMMRAARTIFSLQQICQSAAYFAPKAPDLSKLHVPGLANVDDIDSVRASLPEVRFHVNLQVLGPEVSARGQEHLDILRCSIENGGKVGRSHLCDLTVKRVKSVRWWLYGCRISRR
jgi:hypothetical protein